MGGPRGGECQSLGGPEERYMYTPGAEGKHFVSGNSLSFGDE